MHGENITSSSLSPNYFVQLALISHMLAIACQMNDWTFILVVRMLDRIYGSFLHAPFHGLAMMDF